MDSIAILEEAQGWQLAIEFRDKSWYNDTVYEFLESYNAIIVAHDMPASATPLIDMEASCVYLRFHGEKGDYRGDYPEGFLWEYADYVKDWLSESKTVYAYFNNTMGNAVHNALALQKFSSL